jgi:hypothetical protein
LNVNIIPISYSAGSGASTIYLGMARVGDQERERTVALLRRHYLRGRLSVEELMERLEVALTARHDSDVRLALRELPATWRDQAMEARSGLGETWRAARRTAFVIAVWSLWWVTSLVLLIGFVVSVLLQGVSLTNSATFAALWLACTFAARRVARQRLRPRG